MKPTIVTAYYRIKSKHSDAEYDEWIKTFAETLENPVVFFGEAEWCERFKSMRNGRPTACVWMPFESLSCYPMADWGDVLKNDKFNHLHTEDLYIVWNEKPNFVAKAINLNPFDSEVFAWVDIGCFRIAKEAERFKAWPDRLEQLTSGRLHLLQVYPFLPEDSIIGDDGLPADFHGTNRIGGTIMVGDKPAWSKWNYAYYEMLRKFVSVGRHCGLDQNAISTLALTRPDLVKLIEPADDGGDKWFYLQRHFV